jgi:ABC-type methionine transport system ATPase subunit
MRVHEHELVREFHQRVITIDRGRVVGDTKGGSVSASDDDDDDDYTLEYSEYEEDTDLTDDEITDNNDGVTYDDEDDYGDLPQYPDNVVIVPD